jgi:hypothetical protein
MHINLNSKGERKTFNLKYLNNLFYYKCQMSDSISMGMDGVASL